MIIIWQVAEEAAVVVAAPTIEATRASSGIVKMGEEVGGEGTGNSASQ